MINLSNKKVSVYKGDYKPVNAYKNTLNLGGYKTVGMDDNKGVFNGTYNDFVTLYGKCGYKQSKNLCPTPKAESGIHEEGNERYSWTLTPKSDGRFDFWGAMATGYTISQVTLPAGTYSASGCELVSLWWEENGEFQTLPCTFTLEKESNVQCVLWYTKTQNITLENQYIQIEKGADVTDFAEYCGDPFKPPSPDNIKQVIGAKGKVTTRGKNLFEFKQGYVSGGTGSIIESLENGAICQGALSSNTQHTSWGNGWYTFANRATVNLKAGDTVTISCDYTVLELAEGRSMSDFNSNDGIKKVGIYLYNSGSGSSYVGGAVENQPAILGEPTRLYTTYTVAEDSNYHPLFTLNSNKVKIENIQIEYGSTATKYDPYFSGYEADLPELFGIEVDDQRPYNYTESVDGETKYYMADSITNNVITRRIGKIELTGQENWFTIEDPNHETEFALLTTAAGYPTPINNSYVTCFCNFFNGMEREEIWYKGMGISVSSNYIRISQGYYNIFGADINVFKNFLKNQYESGNPVTVYYVLKDTQIETVSQDFAIKTFPHFTEVEITPDENMLSYGAQKCIKVSQ